MTTMMNTEVQKATDKRNRDYQNDLIVQEFLNNNLYSTSKCPNITRYDDLEHQIAGIDLLWGRYKVDEKASTYYTHLETFAHEIGQINRAYKWQRGWFNAENSKTDLYVYLFIDECTKNGEYLQSIEEAEIMILWKSDIVKYLNSKGWTEEELLRKEREIRSAYNRYGNNWWEYVYYKFDDIKFSISGQLFEKPINVLIKRDELRKIAKKVKTIKP